MNKVQALYSRLFKSTEKTVSKLCFENLQNNITVLALKTIRKVLRRLHRNLLQGLLIYLSKGQISSTIKNP